MWAQLVVDEISTVRAQSFKVNIKCNLIAGLYLSKFEQPSDYLKIEITYTCGRTAAATVEATKVKTKVIGSIVSTTKKRL